ncbi:MAG: GNAT family N-acetyltransferase [Bacillota bacterium]|nr:GNAT family N-acetyltransferase [Bacillota bacterium]MDW7682864.1 GNAT family N-acetyltransferase [Bacillota bacterium]
MVIREIREDDAPAFLDLQKQIEEESMFMLLTPGERETAVEEKRKLIRDVLSRDNQTIFVVENDKGELVGYLRALGGEYEKTKHCAYITVGVLEEYTGQGLGTSLLETLDRWAQQKGLHRLELIVMQNNEPAVNLYRKMGYDIEGTKKDSLMVGDEFVDEYYMGKLITEPNIHTNSEAGL